MQVPPVVRGIGFAVRSGWRWLVHDFPNIAWPRGLPEPPSAYDGLTFKERLWVHRYVRQQSSRAFVEGVKRGLVNAAWGVREWLSPPDAAGAGRRDDGVDGRGPMPHHEVGREDVDADRVPVRGEHDEESARAEAGGERAERPQETQAGPRGADTTRGATWGASRAAAVQDALRGALPGTKVFVESFLEGYRAGVSDAARPEATQMLRENADRLREAGIRMARSAVAEPRPPPTDEDKPATSSGGAEPGEPSAPRRGADGSQPSIPGASPPGFAGRTEGGAQGVGPDESPFNRG